jgi:hypothetical protein
MRVNEPVVKCGNGSARGQTGMKAQEVLRRYAAGERNFCSANLRGANFKGQDLSGANFSGADIRSANFTNATLRDANFTGAQGGLQRRWVAVQICLVALLAGLSGFMHGLGGTLAAFWFSDGSIWGSIAGCIYVLLMAVVFVAIAKQGLSFRSLGSVAIAIAVTVAVSGAFALTSTVMFARAFAVTAAFMVTITFIAVLAGIVTAVLAGIMTGAAIAVGASIAAVAFATVGSATGTFSLIGAVASVVVTLLLSLYMTRQILRGDAKFAMARRFGLKLSTLGGTSFRGADLTRATFDPALLQKN